MPAEARLSSVSVLGIEVHAVRSEELLQRVEDVIRNKGKAIFEYANIHALNLAQRYGWFRNFLNKADILYADGQGVRLGAWILGSSLPERIVLTTWIWKIAQWCEENGYSIFLLGSNEGVVEQAAVNALGRFPRLQIVGTHHGYFDKFGVDSEKVIDQINRVKPDILFVGFGMPLQEEWLQKNMKFIETHAIFSAGSCFEYMAGTRSVCPAWLSKAGFEWLYRLAQEPRRLFFRYVIGNPLFVARVLGQRFIRNHPRE